MSQRRVIGLTGGIATGKTTVANFLVQTYGFAIFDADVFAREAVAPGSPVLQQIVDRYGREILLLDGQLDRSRLGQIVFKDPSERRWLEAQIHPDVRRRFVEGIQQANSTVVLVVPLLFEAEMTDLVSEIWVVFCPLDRQLERLQQRNGYREADARSRIEAQMPLEQKCQRANLILDNSGDRTVWQHQIRSWLEEPING
ncbi:MAG: dephospho-CoA kinase [Cyanobacteria bacterium SID2]|nr:dephospho-CoA kinase [Cyanobacteria bacterium SID2]MBP0005123.1 dephospho-CoA kinase [Cyanobacteria bacterium SBC]